MQINSHFKRVYIPLSQILFLIFLCFLCCLDVLYYGVLPNEVFRFAVFHFEQQICSQRRQSASFRYFSDRNEAYLLDSKSQVNLQKLWLKILSVIVFSNFSPWILGPIKSPHHKAALNVSGKEVILLFPQLKNNRMDQDGKLTIVS